MSDQLVIDNPPYEPPPGGADVAPPVVLEEPPDPEVAALIEATQLPPDPRDEPDPQPPPPADPPANVDVPAVLGSGIVGEPLSCTMGNWTGEPFRYDYQWLADDTEVSIAGDVYVVAPADSGTSITCVVTATNQAGATSVTSNAVFVV